MVLLCDFGKMQQTAMQQTKAQPTRPVLTPFTCFAAGSTPSHAVWPGNSLGKSYVPKVRFCDLHAPPAHATEILIALDHVFSYTRRASPETPLQTMLPLGTQQQVSVLCSMSCLTDRVLSSDTSAVSGPLRLCSTYTASACAGLFHST